MSSSMLYHIGRSALRLFLFLFTRFEVKGKENVPRVGPALVSVNHISAIDPPVVGVSLGRPSTYMAKEELFRSVFLRSLLTRLGAFPVHRGRPDKEAFHRAEQALSGGRLLVMFPEGARMGNNGYLAQGFLGAALIAGRARVPVVPVGITGTEGIRGWRWIMHRPRITVNIGRPFSLTQASGKKRRAELTDNTEKIMGRIAELCPDRRGRIEVEQQR